MKRHIKSLTINGFNTFEEGQEFYFSPITLLYGDNNTGKSVLWRLFSTMGTVYNFPITHPVHNKIRGFVTMCGDDDKIVKYSVCGDDELCCQAHKAEVDGETIAKDDVELFPSMKACYNDYGRFIDGNPFDYTEEFLSEVAEATKAIMGNAQRGDVNGDGEEGVYNIVEDAMALEENSVFSLNNPETYLSPQNQERLMNFLIDIAQRKNLQLVIETHSDTIINTIRMAYKEGTLQNKDARVLFFSRVGDEKSTVKTIMFDENGTCSDNPDGFLDHMTDQLLRLI